MKSRIFGEISFGQKGCDPKLDYVMVLTQNKHDIDFLVQNYIDVEYNGRVGGSTFF